MRRRNYDPTIDGRILEPRILQGGVQPPADAMNPSHDPPDPGPSSSPPGDFPATDPGLC